MSDKEQRTNIDYRNTAGWKLMQHEENLKKMLKKGKGENNGIKKI